MRRRISNPTCLAVVALLSITAGCGKRADPLAPYVKTPQPPTALEVAQVGDEIEIRVLAPRTTTENRPLPVIQIEWYEAPATGDFGKTARVLLREDVAPGELRVKRFPRPAADARFSVRAFQGKAQSTYAAPVPYKAVVAPARPSDLTAVNTPNGIELHWTNPPGAEPWPAATVSPSPSSSLSPSPTPGTSSVGALPVVPVASPAPSNLAPAGSEPVPPLAAPSAAPTPTPESLRAVAEGNEPGLPPMGTPTPAASPSVTPKALTSPTPTPAPPTGIRIFRTDGPIRLAREPLQASTWLDASPKPGETPCYSLRYASSLKPLVESAPTDPVCVEAKDIVPPEPPSRLVGDVGANFVELSWLPSPSTDVVAYRLYTLDVSNHGTLLLQTEGPILRVRDPNMTSGARSYTIAAIDKGGNESVLSPPLKIVVP